MKRIFFTVAVATTMTVFGLQAQNEEKSFNNDRERLDFQQYNRKIEHFDGNGSWHQSIVTSPGLQVTDIKRTNENIKSYVNHKEIKNQPSNTKNNFQFKLFLEGNWDMLAIGNNSSGDDYFYDLIYPWNMEPGEPYEVTLPEGYYDILVSGGRIIDGDFCPAHIFFEQVHIDKDTEMTANMEDAIRKITASPVDINNYPFDDLDMRDIRMHYTCITSMMTLIINYLWFPKVSDVAYYVNDFGKSNRLCLSINAYEYVNGDNYLIAMPIIDYGLTEDLILQNQSDELFHYSQMFDVPEGVDSLYSHVMVSRVVLDFETGWTGSNISFGFSDERVRDKDTPYSLYTNVRNKETPVSEDINVFASPVNAYLPDPDLWDNRGMVFLPPMSINKDDDLIVNFVPAPIPVARLNNDASRELLSIMGNNQLTKVWNKDEFYYEGYRTPHLYYQANNINAENHPWGMTQLSGGLVFLGEYGEMKFNHGDVLVKMTGDGEEIFNDCIYLFNKDWLDDTKSLYQIEITNDEVFAYGRNMVNHTVIDFDMTKPDANPPTITMLRIIDNEKISMSVTDAITARLEITAGDFKYSFDRFCMAFDKKCTIEVFWSSDNETFYPLPVQEDETKFHPGYGGFYDISLAPLSETNLSNAWITVKIVLTDDVGNSQVQILDPLFFYGDLVGIDETTISGNTNSVAYPNPFNDKVTIELDNHISGEVYFEIYDITGRIIYQQKTETNNKSTFSWNGSYAKSGVYFYGIYNNGNIYNGKIVKQ